MKNSSLFKYSFALIFISISIFFTSGTIIAQQNVRFGVFADPSVNWFSSNTKETINDGSRPGLSFGFTFNKYFSKNYSFSSGLSLMRTGGRLFNTQDVTMSFNNIDVNVDSAETVSYKIQYVNIPLGLKFESTQIGYVTFFADIGLDPRFMIGSKADIPAESITGEAANKELNPVNLSYHIMAGIEYSIGGDTEMIFGLGFDHNFFDVTKDVNLQPEDKVSNNIIKLRIGVNF